LEHLTNIDHHALIQYTRSLGKEVGLSIAPGTRIEALTPYLNLIDRILVLGVNPGWSGQAMIPSTLETVRALISTTPHPVIAFDGGINDDTIDALLEAGIEAICPNSWIFKHPPIKERIEMIHGKLNG
jgi:ribulose-phosphate 3-epimerase